MPVRRYLQLLSLGTSNSRNKFTKTRRIRRCLLSLCVVDQVLGFTPVTKRYKLPNRMFCIHQRCRTQEGSQSLHSRSKNTALGGSRQERLCGWGKTGRQEISINNNKQIRPLHSFTLCLKKGVLLKPWCMSFGSRAL